jgi:hypothetical protein
MVKFSGEGHLSIDICCDGGDDDDEEEEEDLGIADNWLFFFLLFAFEKSTAAFVTGANANGLENGLLLRAVGESCD